MTSCASEITAFGPLYDILLTSQECDIVTSDIEFSKLPKGSFALKLDNNTGGSFRDDQVFIQVVGFDAPGGQVTHAALTKTTVTNAPQGTGLLAEIKLAEVADNDAPDSLKKGGTSYANYAFTLADLTSDKTIFLPGDGKYYGSRIYVSLGAPIYQKVAPGAKGYTELNVDDPQDVNYETPLDWFEFTYDPLHVNPDTKAPQPIPLGGNVTQVDLYSIPMAFDVVGVKGTTYKRGITMGSTGSAGVSTQEDLVRKYRELVSEPFKDLLQKNSEGKVVRFISPFHGQNFQASKNGKDKNYFDDYVDRVWKQFSSNPALLDFYDQGGKVGNRFYGCAPDASHQGQIAFMYTSMDKKSNTGPWYLEKPSTMDVLTNGGKLQPGTQSSKLLGEGNACGREFAAALNRAVAETPAYWREPAKFFQTNGAKNDWVEFWHAVSIDHRAYGMGFDDAADQSSVAILAVEENVSKIRIGVGW